jgi:hypothetical protein
MRFDPLSAGCLHGTEQLIVVNIMSLKVGHKDTVDALEPGKKCPGREDCSRGFAAGRLWGAKGRPALMRLSPFPGKSV